MTDVIIWWTGAVATLAALTAATVALAWLLLQAVRECIKHTLSITRLATMRYWVNRMEREGLTVCMDEYRRMVKEQKPTTIDGYENIEREWMKGDKT